MTGGGAATNSGIDFQSRVGALALVAMLTDVADLETVGLGNANEKPVQIKFETSDEIDDIVIVTSQRKLLVQAKNSISLAQAENSDFAKVIRQFVLQASQGRSDDQYVLVVSPAASSKIRIILRKLCESYRLNDSAASQNPLTKDEADALSVVKSHIKREFRNLTDIAFTERFVIDLLKQVYVRTLDVADGQSIELLAITALAPTSLTDPALLWRYLVTLCLTLARSRLSIDADGLASKVSALVRQSIIDSDSANSTTFSAVSMERSGVTSMGREVILARDENGRVILTDFRRFAEDGSKRLRFVSGFLEFGPEVRWQIIRRAATFAGIEREIEDDALIAPKDKFLFVETNLGDLDKEPAAMAHAAAHDRRMKELSNPLSCITCGRSISEDNSYEVEIDDADRPYEAGHVHRGCLMPTHRILGVMSHELFAKNPNLVDFDFQTWVHNLKSGQGIFNSWRMRSRTGVITIAWNPDNASATTGPFGVAMELNNGTTNYVITRGKVHRMSQVQAEHAAHEINDAIRKAQDRGDPYCWASDDTFGPLSAILSSQDPDPPRVTMAYARALTQATVEAHKRVDNYYAPLFYMTDRETGQIFNLGNEVILLSNPLQVGSMMENWKNAGFEFPLYSTTILAEDRDFDLFMRELQHDSMVAAVDPVFDATGRSIGGFLVAPFADMQDTLVRDFAKGKDTISLPLIVKR